MIQREPVTPSHYYLSDESWDEIIQEYRNGATARELAVKWKVSPGSIYYRAGLAGFGKKTNGDELARAHARAVEEREPTRGPIDWQRYKDRTAALFNQDIEPTEPDGPAELAQQATLASGRAMREGQWGEAKALAALAESYTRLAERKTSNDLTPETAPLALIFAIAFGSEGRWLPRMSLIGARDSDPDTAIKHKFWERKEARQASEESRMLARYAEGLLEGRRAAARLQAGARGGKTPPL